MSVLLMNPNSNVTTTDMMCRIAARALSVAPLAWTAPEGPDLITTPEALDAAAHNVARADIPPNVTAIIVSAFGDPGAATLAKQLTIPVVGIGGAAARACKQPFAVATTTPALADRIDALMAAHARSPYLGCFLTVGDPGPLMSDEAALDVALLKAVEAAERSGAKCVIIGGGPLGAAADRLSGQSAAQLINPILAAAEEVRLLSA
ncbi:aspartate/glutamate racemase family protein [Poseidonocella pacifica]|nr:aspartate/glutamate racemase family protein [Poseidonocella pacifica]